MTEESLPRPPSLKESLRASLDEKRQATLDSYKLDAMAKELPEIRKSILGVNWLLNLVVANDRDSIADRKAVREMLSGLQEAVGAQQLQIDAMIERVDKMSKWAASVDKKLEGMKPI